MQFPEATCQFLPLRTKYSPQFPVHKFTQSVTFPGVRPIYIIQSKYKTAHEYHIKQITIGLNYIYLEIHIIKFVFPPTVSAELLVHVYCIRVVADSYLAPEIG
jgi:hypothetical protein